MGITQELAGYCSHVKFNDLPDDVIDCAKYRFLDWISVACRGSIEDPSQTIYRFVMEMEKGEGVIVGTREKAPFLYSALANGTSSHSIEMDDVNNESSLHPGVVVFPSALATGEMAGASGKRFILAVVLGYEVMIRLGTALGPENSYKRGFHPTGTCGTFGSSVASSKILGLQEKEILNALGISGSQAAGSMEYLAQGAWTKPFHAGWAAHSGMVAALLSRKGFLGPSSILEGRDGFLHAYSNEADPTKVLEGIGSGFQILQTSVKVHACCRYMHSPIDAVLKIVKENNLRPEQVKKIKIGVLRAGAHLIAEPIESKYKPQSIVDAQFSMPFGAASALLYGRAGLKEFQPSMILSRPVRETMRKVECIVDPELDRTFPKQWRATAEILTEDEKRYSTMVEYPRGDPENPLSWDEMKERFHELAGQIIKKDQRLKIVEAVEKLDGVKDMRRWSWQLLRKE
ncbi:MAG: MmgE/PrpD family protein [Desulfobacterales bacterium]|nr:MmgE/PrpD family protein [Desulfobacterales bacterium]